MTRQPVGEAAVRSGRVEAVERALALLGSFRTPGESLSLAELAQRTALYKSTILRISGSLVRAGFMHRDARGLYMLGSEMQRLGALSAPQVDDKELTRGALEHLVAATGETASFYVAEGGHRVCLLRHNSPRSARHHLEEGTRHPMDRGAAGAVLTAFAGAPGRAAGAIRRQGWAVSLGGRDPDLAAVAVPLWNGTGRLLGALTVSGLLSRFTPDVIEAARTALLTEAGLLRPRLPLHQPPMAWATRDTVGPIMPVSDKGAALADPHGEPLA